MHLIDIKAVQSELNIRSVKSEVPFPSSIGQITVSRTDHTYAAVNGNARLTAVLDLYGTASVQEMSTGITITVRRNEKGELVLVENGEIAGSHPQD